MASFTLDADLRHVGVLGVGKPAQLILTRSSACDGRAPELEDHQQPYLEFLFGSMLGFELAESVVIEPTTAWTPQEREEIAARPSNWPPKPVAGSGSTRRQAKQIVSGVRTSGFDVGDAPPIRPCSLR